MYCKHGMWLSMHNEIFEWETLTNGNNNDYLVVVVIKMQIDMGVSCMSVERIQPLLLGLLYMCRTNNKIKKNHWSCLCYSQLDRFSFSFPNWIFCIFSFTILHTYHIRLRELCKWKRRNNIDCIYIHVTLGKFCLVWNFFINYVEINSSLCQNWRIIVCQDDIKK